MISEMITVIHKMQYIYLLRRSPVAFAAKIKLQRLRWKALNRDRMKT